MTTGRAATFGAEARRAALAVAVAAALAFLPVLTGSRSVYDLDRYFQHEPFWSFAARSVAAGEAPFWTPHVRAGYPLHANGEASLFHPLALPLALALPTHRALDLFAWLHLVLLGFLTWGYLRELRVAPPVAILGGVAFALSGRMVASAIWAHAVAASCALPLLLWGIERTGRSRLQGALLAAAGAALGALAGRPQRLLPALLFAGAYAAVACLAAGAGPRRAARLLSVAGGVALGLAAGAVQLLPTALFVAESQWAAEVPEPLFRLHGAATARLAGILLPPGADALVGSRCYPGIAVYLGAALGVAAALRRRPGGLDARAWFLLLSIPVLAYVAAPGPGTWELFREVPGLRSVRAPVRFLFPACFAATAFACLAWQRWLAGRPPAMARALAALGSAELVLVCLLTAPTAPAEIWRVRPAALDRYPHGERDETGSPVRFAADGFWIFPRVLAEMGRGRGLAAFAALPPTHDLAMRYDARAAFGYGEPQFAWQAAAIASPTRALAVPPLLDQLGARLLYSRAPLREHEPLGRLGDARVQRNAGALPRALCVPRIAFATSWADALRVATARGFDARSVALLEDGAARDGRTAERPSCRVRLAAESPTRLALELDGGGARELVVFDTWAPGWKGRVDGRPVAIARANGMFRHLSVPAGARRVELRYTPPGFRAGAVISAAALLLAALLAYRAARDPLARPAARS